MDYLDQQSPDRKSNGTSLKEAEVSSTPCLKHVKSLDDESLHTLLVEIEAIVNSRPMTTETISDVKSDIY